DGVTNGMARPGTPPARRGAVPGDDPAALAAASLPAPLRACARTGEARRGSRGDGANAYALAGWPHRARDRVDRHPRSAPILTRSDHRVRSDSPFVAIKPTLGISAIMLLGGIPPYAH